MQRRLVVTQFRNFHNRVSRLRIKLQYGLLSSRHQKNLQLPVTHFVTGLLSITFRIEQQQKTSGLELHVVSHNLRSRLSFEVHMRHHCWGLCLCVEVLLEQFFIVYMADLTAIYVQKLNLFYMELGEGARVIEKGKQKKTFP